MFIRAGPEQGGEAWLDQGPSTGRQEAEAVGAIAGAAAEAGDPGDGQGREQDDRPGHLQAQLLGPPYLSGMVSTRRGTLRVTLSDPLPHALLQVQKVQGAHREDLQQDATGQVPVGH